MRGKKRVDFFKFLLGKFFFCGGGRGGGIWSYKIYYTSLRHLSHSFPSMHKVKNFVGEFSQRIAPKVMIC